MSYSELPVGTPEAQGIPSQAVLDFVNSAEADVDALHSFILLRHGHRVAQGWWAPPRHPPRALLAEQELHVHGRWACGGGRPAQH